MMVAFQNGDSFAEARRYYREGPLGPEQQPAVWKDFWYEARQTGLAEKKQATEAEDKQDDIEWAN
jgi:hypothetical protein